jgi:hypothetical protein
MKGRTIVASHRRRKGAEKPRDDDRISGDNADARQSGMLRKITAKRRNVLRKLAK